MLSWAVRCVAIMAAIVGGFVWLSGQDLGMPQVVASGTPTVDQKTARTPSPRLHASELQIQAGRHGQYYAQAFVNGVPVSFLVDTGAFGVLLTDTDAERIGLRPSRQEFRIATSTANGTTHVAPVTLRSVSLGGFTTNELPAYVGQKGTLGISLLGMSFLQRLDSYEVQRGTLVLRW